MARGGRPSCCCTVRTSCGSSSGGSSSAGSSSDGGTTDLSTLWAVPPTLLAGLDRAPPQLGVPGLVVRAGDGRGVHLLAGVGRRRGCRRQQVHLLPRQLVVEP